MATTSTNFAFTIATTSDRVNVVSHIANNFVAIDTVMGTVINSSGGLKNNLGMTGANLTNPVITGTLTGGSVTATTGSFQTITATGGALTVNTFNIGTYNIPATIGSTNQILSVVTGNAVWAANSPGTGAAEDLSNLSAVAINTNLNTFTAGRVTIAEAVVASGSLSGLAFVNATTGTLGGLTVTGTASIPALVGVTGGTATFGALAVGTYSYPTTVGSTGQVLTVTTGNAVWLAANTGSTPATLIYATSWTGGTASPNITIAASKVYDIIFQVGASTGFQVIGLQINTASGNHRSANIDTGTGSYDAMVIANTGSQDHVSIAAKVTLDTFRKTDESAFMCGSYIARDANQAALGGYVAGFYNTNTNASILTLRAAGTGNYSATWTASIGTGSIYVYEHTLTT